MSEIQNKIHNVSYNDFLSVHQFAHNNNNLKKATRKHSCNLLNYVVLHLITHI